MSQNIPFLFGAGGARPPPLPNGTHQMSSSHSTSAQSQPQPQPTMAQQTAFQQNGQLPGVDMSALAGISPEQLAAIARLFQAGALTLPPPPPSGPIQTDASVPTTFTQLQIPTSAPPAPIQPSMPTAQQVNEDMDAEDGELEDGELSGTPEQRGFLRPPPTGPRIRSASPRAPLPRPEQRRASPRSAVPKQQSGKNRTPQPQFAQINGIANGHRALGKDTASKMFILEVVKAGYTFEDLAKEVGNAKPLVRMFKQLDLPVPAQYASGKQKQPQPNGTRPDNTNPTTVVPQLSAPEETRSASLTKRPAPAPVSKAPPRNRAEYLAKLAAVKNPKPAPAAVPTPTPNPAAKPATPIEEPKPATTPKAVNGEGQSSTSSATKSVYATDKVRQRLEALNAERAAKGLSTSNEVLRKSSPATKGTTTSSIARQTMSSPTTRGLGAGLANVVTKAAQEAESQPPSNTPASSTPIAGLLALAPSQGATSQVVKAANQQQPLLQPAATQPVHPPTQSTPSLSVLPLPTAQQAFSLPPPTPTRTFSGLPGLFMVGTPVQASPTVPQAPSSAPQALPNVPQAPPAVPSQMTVQPHAVNGTPTASPAPLTVTRKRPVASDFDDVSSKPASVKRPFGQSRGNSEDESFIIDVSEDEDDVEEESGEVSDGAVFGAGKGTKPFRDAAPLSSLPPKPISARGLPEVGPPGTPGATSVEQEIKRKTEAAAELRRKIAAMEKRTSSNGKVSGANQKPPNLATPVAEGVTATPTPASIVTPDRQDAPKIATPLLVKPKALSDAARALQEQKEILRKQIQELEQRKIIQELEQRKMVDLSKPVPATIHSEPVRSTNEPDKSSAALSGPVPMSEPAQALQLPQPSQGNEPRENAADLSVSEEGELDEDSMSDLYTYQEAQDTGQEKRVDDVKIGSQVTTASATSAAEDDSTVVVNKTVAPTERQLPDNGMVTPVEIEVEHAVQQQSQPAESHAAPRDSLTQSIDQVDAEGDDDDLDNIYESSYPQPPKQELPANTAADDGIEEGEVSDLRASSRSSMHTSSDDSEEYEPGQMEQDTHLVLEKDNDTAAPTITRAAAAEPVVDGMAVAEDLASQLQPAIEQQAEQNDQPPKPKTYYTPYESPLKAFSDYRYHLDFLGTAPGGFKSLTYSHNIDPNKAVCPFELAGGKCNDKSCPHQHFRTMALSDNELLKNMGTMNVPAYDNLAKQRWNEGLGAVIKQLRTTNIGRDAGAIANKIAEFRREFVGDPVKVLNLGLLSDGSPA